MANINITMPNAQLARIQAAFASLYGYRTTIAGSPNPETLTQFTQRIVREFVKGVVKAYEVRVAAETARTAAESAAEAEITLT